LTPFVNRLETFALGVAGVSAVFAFDVVSPWWPLGIGLTIGVGSFIWRHAGSPTPTIRL